MDAFKKNEHAMKDYRSYTAITGECRDGYIKKQVPTSLKLIATPADFILADVRAINARLTKRNYLLNFVISSYEIKKYWAVDEYIKAQSFQLPMHNSSPSNNGTIANRVRH
jgi:hypothetical protein